MRFVLGIIFRGRKINYKDKTYKVYKAVDIDSGIYGYDRYGVSTFSPLKRRVDLHILSSDNKLRVGDKFDNYKFYAALIDEQNFFDKYYLHNKDYNYDDVKRQILERCDGYYTLGNKMTLNKVEDEAMLKIVMDEFKDILDDWFVNELSQEKIDKTRKQLLKYGTFLTDKEYLFNPAIGRDDEIERLERSLLSFDTSGMLVGEAGVGKTAIVEGLAYKIQKCLVHEKLKDYQIISINTSSMISGCHYVGDKEKRMEDIINELKKYKNIIMFIDEIHSVIGAGAGEKSNLDIANILKPHLERGDIKIIGSTTENEYDNLMDDVAFKRRFKKIRVLEPDEKTIYVILDGVIEGLEKYYNVKFDFNNEVRDKIYKLLYNLTNKQNVDYKEKSNNPDLILQIVKEAFNIADYKYHSELCIEDIIKSIDECDRIYSSVREKYKLELKRLDSTKSDVIKEDVKVLKFTMRDNDKNSLT